MENHPPAPSLLLSEGATGSVELRVTDAAGVSELPECEAWETSQKTNFSFDNTNTIGAIGKSHIL